MRRILAILVMLWGLQAAFCPAQDMRVYTTVSRKGSDGVWEPYSHSLTLFHSGKVYDFMEEVGEVVIYEPMNDRFIFLDGNYRVAELRIEELSQYLKASESESQKYLADLKTDVTTSSDKAKAALEFQLRPQFDQKFDAREQRLQMISDQMIYDLKTGACPNPDRALDYLAYADWAARLNHILHPKAMLPEPRLAVNAALRQRKRIPLSVTRKLQAEGETDLKSEHQFSWEFTAIDRQQMTLWESRISSKDAVWVSFRDYQKKLVTSK